MEPLHKRVDCSGAPVRDRKDVVGARQTPFDGRKKGGRHAYGRLCRHILHNLDFLLVLQHLCAVWSFLQHGNGKKAENYCVVNASDRRTTQLVVVAALAFCVCLQNQIYIGHHGLDCEGPARPPV